MHVFLLGVPQTCGGANQESGDTALLWQQHGVEVTCLYFTRCHCGLPVLRPEAANPWTERLRAAGISFVPATPGRLMEVAGLPGALCASFCNQHAAHNWPELRGIGCRLIWSPTMTYTLPYESDVFRQFAPSAVHFQSQFQARLRMSEYVQWGCREFRIIRGAFQPLPFRPCRRPSARDTFVIGRLARPCRTKWTPHLWNILGSVSLERVPVLARCQAWCPELDTHCGRPSVPAQLMERDTVSVTEFLAECHALICPNWSVRENWPRVGLEAMSAGVPVLADDAGGWREMLWGPGVGYLCDSPADYADHLVGLARNESARLGIIEAARDHVRELADPERIARSWLRLFACLCD